jgi:hypothetical protein
VVQVVRVVREVKLQALGVVEEEVEPEVQVQVGQEETVEMCKGLLLHKHFSYVADNSLYETVL